MKAHTSTMGSWNIGCMELCPAPVATTVSGRPIEASSGKDKVTTASVSSGTRQDLPTATTAMQRGS